MKKHIILLLKTLINNNACVEAARTRQKKYNIIGPIFAVFALFFCALPVCVKGFQQQGQDVVSTSYGVDDGLITFFKDGKERSKITLTIEESPTNKKKHVLNMDLKTWDAKYPEGKDSTQDESKYKTQTLTDLHRYTYTYKEHNYLEVYFSDKKGQDFVNFYANIVQNKNPYHPEQPMSVTREEGKTDIKSTLSRSSSFIVFGQEQMFIAIYKPDYTTPVGSFLGDYNNTPVGTDLMTAYYSEDDQIQTLKNFKVFLNQAFINIRFTSTWKNTGINLGINGGVMLLMGFVVWITTRGRNNPFRIYSYWDSQKICFYASLTPGLIGLLGFLSTSLATMIFAMSCGVRVLWLSMRTLRYTAPAK